MTLKTLVAAISIASAVVATADARQVAVSRSGVDFMDVGAVDAFHRDLARAATDVCRISGRVTLAEVEARRACRADALANAVEAANVPTLTALHDGLAPAQRIRPDRAAPEQSLLAAVAAAAETMRAESAPRIIASR
jgi:UrcA family protein